MANRKDRRPPVKRQTPAKADCGQKSPHWMQPPQQVVLLGCAPAKVRLCFFSVPLLSAPPRPASPKGALFLFCICRRLPPVFTMERVGFDFMPEPEGKMRPFPARLRKVRAALRPGPHCGFAAPQNGRNCLILDSGWQNLLRHKKSSRLFQKGLLA